MNPKITIAFSTLFLALAMTPGAHAQSQTCQTVQFSDSLLQRFPLAREACQDVITRDGQQYAVIKADLVRVTGSTARVRAKLSSGQRAPAQNIRFDPKRRVLVNGKALQPSQLAVGQELTAYVKLNEPAATLAPADEDTLAVNALEDADTERVASTDSPAMPTTASSLPLIGAGGALLLVLGAGLAVWRRNAARNAVWDAASGV
jgi:hypothetical protein